MTNLRSKIVDSQGFLAIWPHFCHRLKLGFYRISALQLLGVSRLFSTQSLVSVGKTVILLLEGYRIGDHIYGQGDD